MHILKQGQSAQILPFRMVQSSDHLTPLTGASPVVTLSKNGNPFAAAAGLVLEISQGWYKLVGDSGDSDTLGPLLLHATAASGDPANVEFEIVAFDPLTATVPANLIQIDGATTAGGSAQLTLSSLILHSTSGVAFSVSSTAGFAAKFSATGSSPAISITGAGTSPGMQISGGTSSNSDAIVLGPSGTGNGVNCSSGGFHGNLTGSVANVTGDVGGNVVGSVASVTGDVGGSVVGSVASVENIHEQTADAATLLGAPAGASVSADIAAVAVLAAVDPLTKTLGSYGSGTAGNTLKLLRAFSLGKRVVAGNAMQIYDTDGTTLLYTIPLAPSGGPFTTAGPMM